MLCVSITLTEIRYWGDKMIEIKKPKQFNDKKEDAIKNVQETLTVLTGLLGDHINETANNRVYLKDIFSNNRVQQFKEYVLAFNTDESWLVKTQSKLNSKIERIEQIQDVFGNTIQVESFSRVQIKWEPIIIELWDFNDGEYAGGFRGSDLMIWAEHCTNDFDLLSYPQLKKNLTFVPVDHNDTAYTLHGAFVEGYTIGDGRGDCLAEVKINFEKLEII